MQVQWNHLNLGHALHFGGEGCCPLPPIHSCLLRSHNTLHTVWGLLFKPMHPLTISHMYITTSHAPSASFICSTKPLPGNRLPCSWIFVSLCPHSVPHWSQPGCRTDMEVDGAMHLTMWAHHWRQRLPLQQPSAQGGARLLEFGWMGAF